jgi:hypothetical protein
MDSTRVQYVLPQFPTLGTFRPAPSAWSIAARHLIPIGCVLFLGWSAAVGVTALFLDGLSALYGLAAVATYFIVRDSTPKKGGLFAAFQLALSGVIAFALVASLFTFAVGVLYFFAWAYVFAGAGVSMRDLATNQTLWWTFAGMLVLQVPHVLWFIRSNSEVSARALAQKETGFHLFRLAIVIVGCSVLTILPGRVALIGVLMLTQAVRAAVEIYGQDLIVALSAHKRPSSLMSPSARSKEEEQAKATARRERRHRK